MYMYDRRATLFEIHFFYYTYDTSSRFLINLHVFWNAKYVI